MAFFDWNKAIPNVPDEWRSTEGKGVRIAILDSGAQLNTPALQHLNQPGRKFNVARPDYTLAAALAAGGGNDNVADQASFGEMHGTACLSVLAGLPESAANGIKGVAPQAEIFIIRIMDSSAMYRKGYVLDALELALALKVDVVTCAILPTFAGTYTDGRRDVLFKKLRDTNTAFISTLVNTTLPATLTNLRFPADQPEAIVAGVAQVPVLNSGTPASVLYEKIDFLTAPVKVASLRMMSTDPYPMANLSSSLTTTALAGVVALAFSQKGERIPQANLLSLLQSNFNQPYDPTAMLAATQPIYFTKPA